MDQIKTKPTDVFGCRFRSKLESCWAMFFSKLGLPWLYEPARFRYCDETYIPDFCVSPSQNLNDIVWFEIKPYNYTAREPHQKYLEFGNLVSAQLGHKYYILCGPPNECNAIQVVSPQLNNNPFQSSNEIEVAGASLSSMYPDVGMYSTKTNKAKRVLKQKTGHVSLLKTADELYWTVREMPGCWEAKSLLKQCKAKLGKTNLGKTHGEELLKLFQDQEK